MRQKASRDRSPASSLREELPEINRDYLEARNAKLRSQAFLVEAQAREKAGELISRQAQFIFICLRQSILNFPTLYARHMVGLADEHQAKAVLTKAAHEFLTELASFSEKAIDSNWLASVDGDNDAHTTRKPQARPPVTGAEIKREAEKARKRRKQKTETMRRLRARKR